MKNSRHGLTNPNARYRKLYTLEEVMASQVVSDPLRLLDICATSENTVIELPNFAIDSAVGVAVPDVPFRDSIASGAYEQAGIGTEDVSFAEVYDLSTALELDWYENIGFAKPGDAEILADRRAAERAEDRDREHRDRDRRPLPPSGRRAGLGGPARFDDVTSGL